MLDARCWMLGARASIYSLRENVSGFRPGGTAEISRWWSEAEPPEQQRTTLRPGRGAGQAMGMDLRIVPASLPGRETHGYLYRWLRFAPPPANVQRAFSAKTFS